ncbi:MAG TPA: MBL fold metallo-hydrolase [Oceanospirillales bacterium]|nr:MBL fold metallo-hydrolase [Oceanospirillales bacterium]
MRFASLGSGSKGNATVIESNNTRVLIDCGFNRKHTRLRLQELDLDLRDLDAILVSHEHSDHAKGVVLVCESINKPFYATYGTARSAGWLSHPLWRCIDGNESFKIDELSIHVVVVPHDSQEPVQFVVSDAQYKVGVLSDLGSLTPHVIDAYQNCHGLLLEANHDLQLLQQGPYPPALKRRVAGDYGHLNNQQAADLLSRLIWSGTQHVLASHISDKNNSLELVKKEFAKVLECDWQEIDAAIQGESTGWRHLTNDVE